MNHLTLGESPDEYIELEDGSVEIPNLESVNEESEDFMVNLADQLPQEELKSLASEYSELVERDKKSREKRDKQYEEGLRRSGLGDDAPGGAEFDGASRVVHPVLAEACVDFASRAIKELFPASGPVKPWVTDDINPMKLERANRKSRFMNWQLTTQIKEYRDELEQLLTQVPMGGSQYQKFWYDDRLRRPRAEFVPVDDVFLPYAATSFYTSPRVTHRQLITKAEFRQRISSGLYIDVFDPQSGGDTPEESSSSQANNKIEGREEDGYNEDGLRSILEIYTWLELEDDPVSGGEYAPYILTIDEDSEQVLSLYRNWDEDDPTREKLDWFVEWKFIPWRGAYGIGFPHLIGGLSAALTGSLRALLDSAHINNAASMLKLKSGRVVGQNTQVNITEVTEIEAPAGIDDIRKIAMPMPFNPPSPVLHQLMNDLYALAKGVIATSEDSLQKVGDRTPVGTTMALIEQGSQTYSAIHARLHASQRKALEIIHRIDSKYLDDIVELEDVNITRDDFLGTPDVIPVSDLTMFSEAQRFAQSQAVLQMAQQDAANPSIPWNQVAVRRRLLKQMRIDGIDELLPPVKTPLTSSVADENAEGIRGTPLKADQSQDHMSHIQGHLAFISSPLQLDNPLVPPQAIQMFLGHIEEHIQMLSAVTTGMALEQMAAAMAGMPEEQIMVQAIQQTQGVLSQQLAPVFQQIGMIQQKLQQRTPPQPMPPEVQASIQIAQMDTQRKAQYDQAMIQIKQAEIQATQQQGSVQVQMEQARMQFEQQLAMQRQQMEATAQQFQQYIAQMKQQTEFQVEQMRQQVELLKNREDNDRSQRTELLKNRDDNETKLMIAGMEQSAVPDMQPQLDELSAKLDELNQREIREALDEALEAMNENSTQEKMV